MKTGRERLVSWFQGRKSEQAILRLKFSTELEGPTADLWGIIEQIDSEWMILRSFSDSPHWKFSLRLNDLMDVGEVSFEPGENLSAGEKGRAWASDYTDLGISIHLPDWTCFITRQGTI